MATAVMLRSMGRLDNQPLAFNGALLLARARCARWCCVAAAWAGLLLASSATFAKAPQICTQIDDSMARLDCYDRSMRATRRTDQHRLDGDVPAPEAASPVEPEPQIDPFWVDTPEPLPGPPAKQAPMSATVAMIRQGPSRKLLLRLDNGQIWRQVKPRFMQLQEGDEVVIQAARLGGYILTRAHGGSTRVQMLRP